MEDSGGALLLVAAVFFFQDKDLHDLVEKKKAGGT